MIPAARKFDAKKEVDTARRRAYLFFCCPFSVGGFSVAFSVGGSMPPAAGEIAADLDRPRRPDADDGPPDVDDRHTARAGAMRATVSPRRPPYIAI